MPISRGVISVLDLYLILMGKIHGKTHVLESLLNKDSDLQQAINKTRDSDTSIFL